MAWIVVIVEGTKFVASTCHQCKQLAEALRSISNIQKDCCSNKEASWLDDVCLGERHTHIQVMGKTVAPETVVKCTLYNGCIAFLSQFLRFPLDALQIPKCHTQVLRSERV